MKKLIPYAKCLGLLALVTLAGEFIHRRFEPTNLVMLYLLAVVIAAGFWGRGPALFTSGLGVLTFDYLFIPPRFTLSVDDTQYVLTFIGLFSVGLVIAELTQKIRTKALETNRRETREKLQAAVLNSLSHDLRTPLVTITGALSSVLRHPDTNSSELIRSALHEATRLNRIVDNLLDMTRIESGALNITARSCGLREMIGTCLNNFKTDLGEKAVVVDIPRDLPDIPMDPILMMKVLTNIIDNAVKYSTPGSPLRIKAVTEGDLICLSVHNEGPGIPPKDLPHIFEKFYRGQHSVPITGTGLGLSICKGIVELHGGRIRLESQPQRNATLILELPTTPHV
jgi:two-component system sensor histidine kinase KdpD